MLTGNGSLEAVNKLFLPGTACVCTCSTSDFNSLSFFVFTAFDMTVY